MKNHAQKTGYILSFLTNFLKPKLMIYYAKIENIC